MPEIHTPRILDDGCSKDCKALAQEPAAESFVQGASWLIGLQFISRALTFVVNQVLIRHLSPELLGASTQLELYSISVLYFSRESLRVAIQRQTDFVEPFEKVDKDNKQNLVDGNTAAGKSQTVVNLAYISICMGGCFTLGLGQLFFNAIESKDANLATTPYFWESLVLFGVAAFVELLAEPCFVVAQQKSRYRIRAAAEGVATVLRCLMTCFSAMWAGHAGKDIGLLPFAFGQSIYSATLACIYFIEVSQLASTGGFSLALRPITPSAGTKYLLSYFSKPLLSLGVTLFAQSTLKHILTQGDTFLMASLTHQRAQGVYALASNYGGLVARLILQPIEESSRNYFGRVLSSVSGQPPKETVEQASASLHLLLRLYIVFSVGILAIGPSLAPVLLGIVAGPQWTSSGAGHVLGMYCYYIPMLAINGITEAFVSSVASEKEVNRQSIWMFAFSAGFIGAGYLLLRVLRLGAEGLVWANIINMAFRIIWSMAFVNSYLKRQGSSLSFASLMPQPLTIAAGVGTAAMLTTIETQSPTDVWNVFRTGVVVALFAGLLILSERNVLAKCHRILKGR